MRPIADAMFGIGDFLPGLPIPALNAGRLRADPDGAVWPDGHIAHATDIVFFGKGVRPPDLFVKAGHARRQVAADPYGTVRSDGDPTDELAGQAVGDGVARLDSAIGVVGQAVAPGAEPDVAVRRNFDLADPLACHHGRPLRRNDDRLPNQRRRVQRPELTSRRADKELVSPVGQQWRNCPSGQP